MGFRRSGATLDPGRANEARDWRIYAELARRLIVQARRLYTNEDLGFDLGNTVYALDSTTIDLCLAVFPSRVQAEVSPRRRDLAPGGLPARGQAQFATLS